MSDEILIDLLQDAVYELVKTYFPHEAPIFEVIWDTYWEVIGGKDFSLVDTSLIWQSRPTGIMTIGAQGGGAHCDSMPTTHTLVCLLKIFHGRDLIELTESVIEQDIAMFLNSDDLDVDSKKIIFEHGPAMVRDLMKVQQNKSQKGPAESTSQSPMVFAARIWDGERLPLGFVFRHEILETDSPEDYTLYIDEAHPDGTLINVVDCASGRRKAVRLTGTPYRLLGLVLRSLFEGPEHIRYEHILKHCGSKSDNRGYAHQILTRLRQELDDELVNAMLEWDGTLKAYKLSAKGWTLLWIREGRSYATSMMATENMQQRLDR